MQSIYNVKIWVRLVVSIWLMIVIAWGGMLIWTAHAQRDTAIDQARDFAVSVHQMTLAGLTGMMITGTVSQRGVFLDQIKQSNNILSLRVVRGNEVIRQFGQGKESELVTDPIEQKVLQTGQPVFEIRRAGASEIMTAVMPAIARKNYLGKNCLGCHAVKDGAVLGTVSMDISLDTVNRAVRAFTSSVYWVAFLLSVPLILVIYFLISRFVTTPLDDLTSGLNSIAEGNVDLAGKLRVLGSDEIASATAAFNRVMEKAQQLLRSEKLAAEVFENTLEGIIVCDRQGRIRMVNPAFTRTTGYTPDEVIGRTPAILQSGRHDAEFYKSFWRDLTTKGQWQGDIWNKRKNGEVYPEWLNISAVKNGSGKAEYYIGVFSDITERKRQEALITYQAYHDALTGLPNRALFKDRLEQALTIARRQKSLAGVMFLDLDRFKFINDTLGHDAGDELLKEVAKRVRSCVREQDTVARLGGDEFTVLLPQIAEAKNAELVASKILTSMKQSYRLAGKDVFVTPSIGISISPQHGDDADTLMKKADTAMYRVKNEGRAGYCMYTEELSEQPTRQLQLESDLRRAMENHEFMVHYQPQLNLETGKIIGLEALVRWNHPQLRLIPSVEFMQLAEETGLIIPIGAWVLQTACEQAAAWLKNSIGPLVMAVNLSPRQFHYQELVATIRRTLQASGLPPQYLELEITEGLAMQNVEFTVKVLQALADLGVQLAITEFGVGFYSSVNDLKKMPVNTIKIDRSFIRDINTDQDDISIVAGLISMSRTPNMRVVAVGVEKKEQLERLKAMQCDNVQGLLFSRPLPADEIPELFKQVSISGSQAAS